jgi:glycerol-3-phosphate dehydrogenase (NAD+)
VKILSYTISVFVGGGVGSIIVAMEELEPRKRISVIGAGAFGTSLATIAARNGHDVVIYARDSDIVNSINSAHLNSKYLSDFTLLSNISGTTNVTEALTNMDLIILALPAQVIPDFLGQHKDIISDKTLLCNSAKGLYLKENCLLSEVIPIVMGNFSFRKFMLELILFVGRDQPYSVLSGPSFAREMMLNHPTAVVVASKYLFHAVTVQRLLSSNSFKVFTSQDILGVQLGGALKNPLAIGAGIIEGMKLGITTKRRRCPILYQDR